MAGGYTDQELPWSGKFPTSAHTSAVAAAQAVETRQYKVDEYRRFIKERGKVTDRDVEDALHWRTGTICSVRNFLVDRGEVTVDGIREFTAVESGRRRTKKHALWRLTTDDERAAFRLRQQQLRQQQDPSTGASTGDSV